MKRLLITCAGLFLCAPLLAQSYKYTPQGIASTEGAHYAYIVGSWSNMRTQQADNMHVGQSFQISQIAFRLDNRSHTSRTAMGRTWSSIKLVMSEMSNYATMSRTFATNTGSNATAVFDKKWSWPTQVGPPLLKPDVWSGVKGQLRFPFTKPWVYSGKNAMLADYTFNKGTLANGATWTSTRAAFFYLDSELITTSASKGTVERIPRIPPRCNDSGISFTAGAYTYGYSIAYGKSSPVITQRGKLVFAHYSYYTAPNAPVVQALGFGGNRNGVNIGANCNPLYVDFAKPAVLMTFQTLPPYGYSGIMGWTVPWQASLASKDIWLQAAWLDTNSKKLSLTSATLVTFPSRLPPDKLPDIKGVYQYRDSTSATGVGPYKTGIVNPHRQYTVK